jgi:hypothetical protein
MFFEKKPARRFKPICAEKTCVTPYGFWAYNIHSSALKREWISEIGVQK